MKCYKLTDSDGKTYGGCQWFAGISHTAPGKGYLCSEYYIHGYEHKLVAVFMNPIHGGFIRPKMWEAEASGEINRNGQLMFGCTKMKTIRKIPIPKITLDHRVEIAILCAKQVYSNPKWNKWADKWLSGKDRSSDSATAAAWLASREVSRAAASAAASSMAASRASWAREAPDEESARALARETSEAAAWAAAEANYAEQESPEFFRPLDLVSIIERVIR